MDKNTFKEKTTRSLQVRSITDPNGQHVISGYALTFNQPSEPMPFVEFIDPSALDSVDLSDVKLLYDHDFGNILARTDSGTLTLNVDEQGLFFNAQLPDTTLGRDVFTNISNGNLKGCSFGFQIADDDWLISNDGETDIHKINKIAAINEISIVSLPAYEETSVEIERSLKRAKEDKNNMTEEEILKRAEEIRSKQSKNEKSKDKDEEKEKKPKSDSTEPKKNNDETDDNERDCKTKEAKRSMEDKITVNVDTEPLAKEIRSLQGVIQTNNGNLGIPVGKGSKEQEKRSLEDFIRTHGQKRDGLSGVGSADTSVLIPKQIIYDPSAEVKTVVDLSQYVNKVSVSMSSGTYPILKHATERMHTVAELEKNPDLAKPVFTNVDWKVDTFRAAIPISNESLDDSATDLAGIVGHNANEQKLNTTNYNISQILQTFSAKTVNSKDTVDKLKHLINVDLDPAYDKMIIASQSAYNILDTLKDGEGRYLLQDNIALGSGKQLLGLPVVVVSDSILGSDGDAKMFVGDMKRAVLYADRQDMQIEWAKNEYNAWYLALVFRCATVQADDKAGYFVTLTGQTTPTPDSDSGTGK